MISYHRNNMGRNMSATAKPRRTKMGASGRLGSEIKRTKTVPPNTLATVQKTRFNRESRGGIMGGHVSRLRLRCLQLVFEYPRPLTLPPTRFRLHQGSVHDEQDIRERI